MTYQAKGLIKCVLCDSEAIGRKLCRNHYNRMRYAKRLHEFPIVGPNDVFHHKYKKLDSGCWEWSGTKNGYGYGIFLLPGEKPVRAHRYMFELVNGPIPEGMVIMHKCDNPPCVNPDHLQLGTKDDNNKDTAKKRRHNYGLAHWRGKLSDEQVSAIKTDTRSQIDIAKEYGVHPSHISRIKSGDKRGRQ